MKTVPCLVIALGCFALPQLSEAVQDAAHRSIRRDDANECSIYMAPSGVKGLEGFGIYTTRDIDEGEPILAGPDSPSIPVLDYRDYQTEATDQWIKVFNEYWWTRGKPDHVGFEADRTTDFQTTFGALPNHHCILDSVDLRYPEIPYDDSILDRFKDPGVGAFSYNRGREFVVSKDVKAGDELFLNYGYCKRKHDSDDWTATIPMPQDYAKAADIAWDWLRASGNGIDTNAPNERDALVASLLPESASHLRNITASSTFPLTKSQDLIPLLAKYVASTSRTPDWVRTNGMCLEHLVARKSQIPQAGYGGFAQHFIPKGDVVVPAPMLQITDKDALVMYDDDGNPDGMQLLLNYCLGHGESTMLLCPATNAGLINHCSERTKKCGPKGPNAKYRWSSGWEPQSDEWRNMTLDEIAKEPGRGLSMEVVTLRDIEPGEEVFVDYGMDFEKAWREHVSAWKPPERDDETFATAKEANEQDTLELLVTGDLRKVSNHSHLFTGCVYWPTRDDRHRVWKRKDPSWVEWDDEDILLEFSDDGSEYGADYSHHGDETHWPCSVIWQDEDGSYTVRIHQADWEREMKWHRNDLPRLLTDYPRESIHYFVQPYASDQYLSGTFRHHIGIPDDIFPEQWKNLKEKERFGWKTG